MKRLRLLLLVATLGLLLGAAVPQAAWAPPPPTWKLTVVMKGNVNGQVSGAPLPSACTWDAFTQVSTPSPCQATGLTAATTVGLNAYPDGLATFTWQGCDRIFAGQCQIENNSTDRTVTVTFTRGFNLSVSITKQGTANGSVKSSPAGIDCPGTCEAGFASGTVVTLTATPAAGSFVGGFTGCTQKSATTCDVTMDQARSVTVTFTTSPPPTSGNVSVTIVGKGTVSSDPPGISCGSICSAFFTGTGQVVLTENPDRGWQFVAWEGCTSVSGDVCTVSLSGGSKSIRATFRDVAVVASLLSASARQVPSGARYADALLRAGEPVTVTMRVVRRGTVLASKRFLVVGTTRLLSVRIPASVDGGRARVELVVRDAAGNSNLLARPIHIPG